MISATAIVVLAVLAGWLIGLSAHARRVVRWKDPGARVAWAATAGLGVAGLLLASLALCLLTRGVFFALVIPASAIAGSIGAWRAGQALGGGESGRNRPPARRPCKSGTFTTSRPTLRRLRRAKRNPSR